ncbi:MAG: hypothetical protein GX112_14620 [Clostridiaceae bacterium]|nr:hypothetical protein [Clostridiaceae bacterium]
MLVWIVALLAEARPVIEANKMKRDMTARAFPLYRGADQMLVVSGTGKLRAAMAVAYLFGACPEQLQDAFLVNFGCCGTDLKAIEPGCLVLAGRVTDLDTGRDYYPDFQQALGLDPVHLRCASTPVRQNGPENGAWYDMESAGFCEAAARFVSADRLLVLKIVSDHLDTPKLDAAVLSRQIKDQWPAIAQICQAFRQRPAGTGPTGYLPEQQAQLSSVAETLRLTATFRRQLDMAVRQAIRADRDPWPLLRQASTIGIHNKRERKQAIDDLIRQLTAPSAL